MLGRKSHTISGALKARVQKIAETPSAVQAKPSFGKRQPRALAFKPGTLTFLGGERLDVVVKNLNAAGARVEFIRGTRLPERVLLAEPLQGIRKWAHVTWQTWGVAGLEFVKSDNAEV
jgi:hypothetical protein